MSLLPRIPESEHRIIHIRSFIRALENSYKTGETYLFVLPILALIINFALLSFISDELMQLISIGIGAFCVFGILYPSLILHYKRGHAWGRTWVRWEVIIGSIIASYPPMVLYIYIWIVELFS